MKGCEQVLESHLIVALSAATKHLVLTGDMKMARHGTPVSRLAKQFRLDVSMLDRLAHNGVDCASLGYQWRTRPQIARLLSPIYESLPDRAPTDGWPSVRGIERACFFLKHEKARLYLLWLGTMAHIPCAPLHPLRPLAPPCAPLLPSRTLTHPRQPSPTLAHPRPPSPTLAHPRPPSHTLTHPHTFSQPPSTPLITPSSPHTSG